MEGVQALVARPKARLTPKLQRMKTVGNQDRNEIEPDPQRAWQRGKRLDAMLLAARAPYPRGAWRLTHAQMNQLDTERQLAQAAKVNRPPAQR